MMSNTTARMTRTSPVEMRIGDNTHHHDQSMYPVSLRAMNKIVRSPTNPIPLLLLDDSFDILI